MDERLQAWREMGYRWFMFVFRGNAYVAIDGTFIGKIPFSPVNRTTLIRETVSIDSSAMAWKKAHPDWVRKEGPYGRQ